MFTSHVKLGQLIYLISAGYRQMINVGVMSSSHSLVIYEWSEGPVHPGQGLCQRRCKTDNGHITF